MAAAVCSSGRKVVAGRSVGGCDLLPGCGSGEAEENESTKQATGQTKDSAL